MQIKNWRPIFLHEPDDKGGGSGGGTTPPPAPPPNANGAGEEKKFSQDELDSIVGERAKRASEGAVKKLLESLGVGSADDLKTALESLKKIEDASKSELDKAKADADKAKADAAKARTDADLALATANERLLKSAVLLEAQKQNVDDSEIASVWLALKESPALREKIKQAENGEFENVADAVKEIVKAHPKWLKAQAKPPTPGTPGPRSDTRKADGAAPPTPVFRSSDF